MNGRTTRSTTSTTNELGTERKEHIQKRLEHLVTLNRHGVGAYEMAVDLLSNDQYAQICQEFAEQRKHFIEELVRMMSQYDAAPPDVQSFGGLMQDIWMNIRSTVSGDDAAVLVECDRGAELALDLYHDAVNESLPGDVETLLRNQFSLLKGEHERIHRLVAALQQ
ncbi:MAG: PA2169 family four-helix-bundle protein [Caldilineaceae bacterium]